MTLIPKFKSIFAQQRKQKRQSVFKHPVIRNTQSRFNLDETAIFWSWQNTQYYSRTTRTTRKFWLIATNPSSEQLSKFFCLIRWPHSKKTSNNKCLACLFEQKQTSIMVLFVIIWQVKCPIGGISQSNANPLCICDQLHQKKPGQKKVWQILNEWLHIATIIRWETRHVFKTKLLHQLATREQKKINKGLLLQSRWNDPIRSCFPLYSTIMQQMFSRATFRVTEQARKRGLLCRVDNNYTSWSLTKMHHILNYFCDYDE